MCFHTTEIVIRFLSHEACKSVPNFVYHYTFHISFKFFNKKQNCNNSYVYNYIYLTDYFRTR